MATSSAVVAQAQAVGRAAAVPEEGRVAMLDSVARTVQRLGRTHGARIWPGFRPDTLPIVFVIPEGAVLTGWRGPLPGGFVPLTDGAAWRPVPDATAASTSAMLGGRAVAQVVVSGGATDAGARPAALTALAFHEAFHVFQAASRREGRRFGQGENAFYIASYPVFDLENEALFALEGRVLAAALAARTSASRRALAQEFVGVRRQRHTRLALEVAAFDDASEMNEGLAQYAQHQALELLRRDGPAGWRADAGRELAQEHRRLAQLTQDASRSFRLRFYSTGPAMARLLDRLSSRDWKSRLVAENTTLERALAAASGVDSVAHVAADRARTREGEGALQRMAEASVSALRAQRQALVDSVLAAPGTTLIIALDSLGRDVSPCGFDPQNHLQVSPSMVIQTRWWRPCAGSALTAEFAVPSVHDRQARTVSGVLPADLAISIAAEGRPIEVPEGVTLRAQRQLKLTSARISVEAARADITRTGQRLIVRPLP